MADAYTGSTINSATNTSNRTAEENVLHKYASYNYVFTLSGLTRAQLASPKRIFSDPLHDIIARTGGIGDANNFAEHRFSTITSIKSGGTQDDDSRTKITPFNRQKAEFGNSILKKNRDIYFERCEITSVPGPNVARKLMNYTTILKLKLCLV